MTYIWVSNDNRLDLAFLLMLKAGSAHSTDLAARGCGLCLAGGGTGEPEINERLISFTHPHL